MVKYGRFFGRFFFGCLYISGISAEFDLIHSFIEISPRLFYHVINMDPYFVGICCQLEFYVHSFTSLLSAVKLSCFTTFSEDADVLIFSVHWRVYQRLTAFSIDFTIDPLILA